MTGNGRSWTMCPLLRIRRLGVRVPPSAPGERTSDDDPIRNALGEQQRCTPVPQVMQPKPVQVSPPLHQSRQGQEAAASVPAAPVACDRGDEAVRVVEADDQ
jgi:hypothetical protein